MILLFDNKLKKKIKQMKESNFKIILTGLLFFINANLYSQSNISIKLLTLSYEFNVENAELYNQTFTDNGTLALEPGFVFSYEAYANKNTAIKLNQAVFYDKVSSLSAFTQLMFKFRVFTHYKHSMYFGIGPNLQLRKSRQDIVGYIDEGYFSDLGDYQYKLSWFSAEIDYNIYLNKKTDLSISLNHISPRSIGLAVGFKYWKSKTPKKKRGCIACPGSH